MPIRLLSERVSSKIAAGEVIERPASVVKELLENSIDASASSISVEIRGGGIEYIRITDNGVGISSSDLELAFKRSATSKIFEIRDLDSIATLGFRGEALPSIGAVSRVSLLTRTQNDTHGASIEVLDGRISKREEQAASIGTSVTVRHLFHNFPGRRKFLRTVATETKRIQLLVTRYALAYPEVKFQLRTERSLTFESAGSGALDEAIHSVYGVQVAESMLDLGQFNELQGVSSMSVSGMVGIPGLSRANRTYISLFVNRRWVQNRMLSYAVEQAYHGFMKERRFPVAVVNIKIPYGDVDVNVHPIKAEVRFKRDEEVFATLQKIVRLSLTTHTPVPDLKYMSHEIPRKVDITQSGSAFWNTTPFDDSRGSKVSGDPNVHILTHMKTLPILRVLGQIHSTYIIAEGPEGMYLIDQHAAHERILFEKTIKRDDSSSAHIQSLLEPVTVELSVDQSDLLDRHIDTMAKLGFIVEDFSNRVYILRSSPSMLKTGNPGQELMDVLDLFNEGGGYESWKERAAYSIACHGAIRAGKVLSSQEMNELTKDLENCDQPHTCPHGRPTMIHITNSRLESEFGRT